MNGEELIKYARKIHPQGTTELSGVLADGTYFGIDLGKDMDTCCKSIRHEDGTIEIIEMYQCLREAADGKD